MLKVIGAGLPRTGTSSLKAALEHLGFGPCYHMFELLRHPEQVNQWRHVATDEPVDWERVFDGYQAALDWPASYFWRELALAYPEARVILTVRDPHRWYVSARDTFARPLPGQVEMTEEETPEPLRPIAALHPLLQRMWEDTFGAGMPGEAEAVAAFRRHSAEVERALPADRLLVYEASQGWGPLCEFLGADPPAGEPFPHLNDTETMHRMFQQAATDGRLVTPFDTAD